MISRNRSKLIPIILGLMVIFVFSSLVAASYPSRPIIFYVGFPAGGSTDLAIRTFINFAEEYVDVPMQVVNIPGAGATLAGIEAIVNREPDGYALWNTPPVATAVYPHLEEDLPYSYDDHQVLGVLTSGAHAFAMRKDAPFNTFEEVLEYARENPGKLTYSGPAIGSAVQMLFEWVQLQAGAKLEVVPYPGAPQAALALVRGDVDVGIFSLPHYFTHEDNFKMFATTIVTENVPEGIKPFAYYYDVPEISCVAQFLHGHANLPQEVVDFWDDVIQKIVVKEEFRQAITNIGLDPTDRPMTRIEAQAYLDEIYELFGEIVAAIN